MSEGGSTIAIEFSLRPTIAQARRRTNAAARPPLLRLAAAFVFLLQSLPCGAAHASAVVPMAVEELSRSAVGSVIGRVAALSSVRAADGRPVTLVRIRVDEVLTGTFSADEIVLKEEGGRIGSVSYRVHGGADFREGERVLLFLDQHPDGSLRTNHGELGKLAVELDRRGMPRVRRRWAPGTLVLSPPAQQPGVHGVPLQDVLGKIRGVGPARTPAVAALAAPPELRDPALQRVQAFRLDGPARFFEPDEAIPLQFLVDGRGDAGLGLSASLAAVADALDRWSSVGTASVSLQRGDVIGDLSTRCPGPNKIRFDDPDNAMSDPVNCRGILALAATRSTDVETKIYGGIEFERARCGFLTFANGWSECTDIWTPCNLAEIATHELGHVIGLGHSSTRASEPDPLLRDATMYFRAHFDGRCADVRQDDVDGVSFLYPVSRPPTITTGQALPAGQPSEPYRHVLTAEGGAGEFTWALEEGGFPGLDVSFEGILSGTPTTNGSTFLRVRATDMEGNSHTKLFLLTVGTPGPVPPTLTRTPSRTPTPTPTPTPPCAGDCDTSGEVTVDELLKVVRIALGEARPETCPAGDVGNDGSVAVDDLLAAVAAAVHGCPPALQGGAVDRAAISHERKNENPPRHS